MAESDAATLVERVLKPEEIITDTAYCGRENDVTLRDMGVALTGLQRPLAPAKMRFPAFLSVAVWYELSFLQPFSRQHVVAKNKIKV